MVRTLLPTILLAALLSVLVACGSSSYSSSKSASPTPAVQASAAAPATQVAAAATAIATTAPASQAQAATPATNPVERVSGTVQSIDGGKVILTSGNSFSITPQTAVTRRVASTIGALQKGQTVAITAKRQPDNTLLASLVMVFAAPPSGFGLGQRPLDAGNLMTNATVDTVEADGFTVTFPGGGAKVALAPDGQVTLLAVGSAFDLASGEMVSAAVRDGVAQTVSIQ
jgi:hypothetical protein